MKNYILIIALSTLALPAVADVIIHTSTTPNVVRKAQIREAIRQDETWTAENIQAHPDLFLADSINKCDELSKRIKVQEVAFLRLEKQSKRKCEDAESILKRYTNWLAAAKAEYKKFKAGEVQFPLIVNGIEIEELDFDDLIADALERIDLAKKSRTTNKKIVKKVEIRKKGLKTKSRELISLRRKLSAQLEELKTNQVLAEIGELTDVLNVIKDMSIDLAEDPTKLTIEDLTQGDPDESRQQSVKEFLES